MKNSQKSLPTAYLGNKPVRLFWSHVAGPELTHLQQSDLIFDEYDCKIRQLPKELLNAKG